MDIRLVSPLWLLACFWKCFTFYISRPNNDFEVMTVWNEWNTVQQMAQSSKVTFSEYSQTCVVTLLMNMTPPPPPGAIIPQSSLTRIPSKVPTWAQQIRKWSRVHKYLHRVPKYLLYLCITHIVLVRSLLRLLLCCTFSFSFLFVFSSCRKLFRPAGASFQSMSSVTCRLVIISQIQA